MNRAEYKLNIIAYANKPYYKFILPFLFFGLKNNPESHFEIVLSDVDFFIENNAEGIEVLKAHFGDRFFFAADKHANRSVSPNTRRFLHAPTVTSEWVYFGDIDIFIMEDVYSYHTALIEEHGIPFSNMIRNPEAPKPRLTGLHFVRFEDYYPITFASDLDLATEIDEHVLYLIMKEKGLMVPGDFRIRPELGIHASLSRDPLGRFNLGPTLVFESSGVPGWNGIDEYQEVYSDTIKSKAFLTLHPHFDIDAKLILLVVESIITDKFSAIEDFANRNIVNKAIFCDSFDLLSAEFAESVRADMNQNNIHRAISKCRAALTLWPQFDQAKIELFFIFLENENLASARSLFEKIVSDPISHNMFKNDPRSTKIAAPFR